MNITEKIALDCGVKIKKPFVDRFFIPIVHEKYIVFDTKSKFQYGKYDYYNDIIELIKPFLQKNQISIFQLSSDSCQQLQCARRFINISRKQESFIISKSKLVVAHENYSLHLASALNVETIGLYSIFNSENTRPVWNKRSQIIIESNRDGKNPSYNQTQEKIKTINLIDPFFVAKKILDTLEISNDLSKYSLVHLGESYNQKIIEVIPDFITNENFLENQHINLRFDMVDKLSPQTVAYWLSNKKVNIITDKSLNLAPFTAYLGNISCITIVMSDNISKSFLNECKKLGLNIQIFCKDEDKIQKYRFDFLDWKIMPDFKKNKKLSDFQNLDENSKFVSSKVLISRGKKYSCEANFYAQKPLDSGSEKVVLSSLFEKELEFFKIYNET